MGVEVTDEKSIKKFAEGLGGYCIKLTFLTGIPDRLLLLPYGTILFVETKTPVNDLSPMQCRWLDRLNKIGFTAIVGRNVDSVISIANELMATNQEKFEREAP